MNKKNNCLYLADDPVLPVHIDVHHFQLQQKIIYFRALVFLTRANTSFWSSALAFTTHKEVGVFNLENSGTHVLWGDLEVEGFVENLVFFINKWSVCQRDLLSIRWTFNWLDIKWSFYGLCQGREDVVLTGLWSLKVLLVW